MADDGSDSPDDVHTWELRPRHLVICPGLSFEEWQDIWESVRATHESINFAIGDALIYSEAQHGEIWSQAVGDYKPEHLKQCKWVCARIEPARRREAIDWSGHRAVAKLPAEVQNEILTRAEANGWKTAEITEAVKEHQAAKVTRRNAKTDEERVAPPEAEPLETLAEAPQQGLVGPGPETAPTADPAPHAPADEPETVHELRALLAEVRRLAEPLSRGKADPFDTSDLHDRIAEVLGIPRKLCLVSDRGARALIPPEWRIRIDGGEEIDGRRPWTVELRKGNQVAIGEGPHLPAATTEAALSAVLSDLSA